MTLPDGSGQQGASPRQSAHRASVPTSKGSLAAITSATRVSAPALSSRGGASSSGQVLLPLAKMAGAMDDELCRLVWKVRIHKYRSLVCACCIRVSAELATVHPRSSQRDCDLPLHRRWP